VSTSIRRQYHVPISNHSKGYNRQWLVYSGGLKSSEMDILEFARVLAKAKHGEYGTLVFPENSLQNPHFPQFLIAAKDHGFQTCIQTMASGLIFSCTELLECVRQHGIFVDVVLDSVPNDDGFIEELRRRTLVRFILPGLKSFPVWKELKSIPPSWLLDVYCYFPYMGENKYIFKPRQVKEALTELQILSPMFKPKVLNAFDIYDPRIDESRDVESLVRPILYQEVSVPPKISVVIPAYNNGRYVLNTLRHLNLQTAQHQTFEVIVVDDGSSDDTSELILNTHRDYFFPFTYIYYPRFKKRAMGDNQFRAGLARNLGVKWARGEILSFLDADILVPPQFINTLISLHKEQDVVQWRRDYLKKEVPSFSVAYSEILKSKDCFIPEGGYWNRFYEDAAQKQWMNLPDYWKYTCTYALSLPKSLFKEVGWFRKTYCFYGFEDTDLGLQLMRKGAKFYFHNESVFHLFHETSRSEFRNSFFHRQKLLKNTAKIFYHNTLDPEAYRVFKYLLSPFL
jgi:glycosyltransferase involved in cell wall biosynthesis